MHDLHSLDTGAAKSAEEEKDSILMFRFTVSNTSLHPAMGQWCTRAESSSSLNSHLQCVSSKEWEKNQAIKLLTWSTHVSREVWDFGGLKVGTL